MLPPYPAKLSLARTPTPLRPLDRISAELGGPRLWLKCDDQTGCLLSGNKIRKLEFVLADALEQGADTLITCGGLQSNHCRATAAAAAQLGLKAHLLLRADPGMHAANEGLSGARDGNLLLDTLCGASIEVIPERRYRAELDTLFAGAEARFRQLGRRPYSIPTGASNGVGIWGYIDASQELCADFAGQGIAPEYVVCASGSGGTQAGLTLGLHLRGSGARVLAFAVCDSEQYFYDKVRQDVTAWQMRYAPLWRDPVVSALHIETIADYIGPGYARSYPAMLATLKRLARVEGVILDPVYTGKAFHGLVSEIARGRFAHCKDIVFVHTGGVYGVFPFRDQLST